MRNPVGSATPKEDALSEPGPGQTEKQSVEEVRLDGKRVVFHADEEIVLQCGKATITLTCDGKVIIKGAYLLSHSSGANRIKGASTSIN